ncbi:uncharacterized protein BJX67DRAFT_24866 [Aspergillus lucknowensis]|uniref:Uncharacterized protein n=1 Tax=Aspergillus lucknowensis TaxID=176173 RepID=A0ABR4M100_9EURO
MAVSPGVTLVTELYTHAVQRLSREEKYEEWFSLRMPHIDTRWFLLIYYLIMHSHLLDYCVLLSYLGCQPQVKLRAGALDIRLSAEEGSDNAHNSFEAKGQTRQAPLGARRPEVPTQRWPCPRGA